jgi:hypothetical protein
VGASKLLKETLSLVLIIMTINDLLLNSLTRFYEKDDNLEKLNKILNNQDKISLRLIDWFVTNYSKKYNSIYLIYKTPGDKRTLCESNNEIIEQFNVFHGYKSQLKAFSKKQFDPFCRRERINFLTKDGLEISTTIGQLNFFRWAIPNMIVEFIHSNYECIENDMVESLKYIKVHGKKNDNGRKPRQELSKSALRGLNKNKLSVCITFD